ncbi:MAG: PQQ-binding-like beta-propeller repeat protein [Terracidiphilus sp.]
MTGFSKSGFAFAAAISAGCQLLALGAGGALGQTAKKTATLPASKPALSKTAAPVTSSSDVGLLDVPWKTLLQPTVKNDWIYYNGDYSGRRYSALSEINAANVSHLGAKWIFRVPGNPSTMEVTPVVVNGIMFVTAQNDVYALDAKTGKQLWHHGRAITQGLIDDASSHHNRGVAILGTRIYMETDDAHLLCLDARTGTLIWQVLYATGNKNYGATSAPMIIKDKVLVGTSGGDDGVRGFLAAYDTKTGKEAWRFWTIPGPGEFGSESWPGDMWQHGGGTTWMPGTYDPVLNTLYWGTGNPCPDFDGSVRPGDDLYTSSLVALDPDTGKMKWYFQFSPHNLYDYDAVQTPILIDAKFKGQPRRLVVTANRDGFLYILDRTDGRFLFAKKFVMSENWASGIDERGRPIANNLIPDEKGVKVCPGYSGGTNWYSPSYSPSTNMFYFRSLEACTVFTAKTEPFEEGREYYSTGIRSALPASGDMNSGSWINAFSLDNLDFAWRDKQVGGGGSAGVMSMAGGLIAFGAGDQFEIDDARTGKPLWSFGLSQQAHSSPMSFGINGKQYLAVAAGDTVYAFGL